MKRPTMSRLAIAGVLLTCTAFGAEKTNFLRASNIRGAKIVYQGGGEAGTIQDVALDPNTGCARFVMIETEGHTIAAPFRVLRRSSGDSYTVTVDKERLMSAPVVNIDRVEEWSNPSFVDRVYSYYGESPSETNISINERNREHGGAAENRNERGMERGREQGQQAERNARGGGSPAPVGEQNANRRNNANAAQSPNAQASPSPSRTRSRKGMKNQPQSQSSPAASERSAARAGTSASPSRGESNPANSPSTRSLHNPESAASPSSERSSQHNQRGESSQPSSERGSHPASSPSENQ